MPEILRQLLDLHALEIVATASLAFYVILAARENPWCWPASIVGVVCYIIVMYQSRLYLEVGLNGYYLVISFIGFFYWLRGGKGQTPLRISRTRMRKWIILAVIAGAGTVVLALIIGNFPDLDWLPRTDVPWWDSVTTVLSLIATWMLVTKRIENWLVWIVTDSLYVPLMHYKGLYFLEALYGFYLVVCIFGWMTWRKHLKRQSNA